MYKQRVALLQECGLFFYDNWQDGWFESVGMGKGVNVLVEISGSSKELP